LTFENENTMTNSSSGLKYQHEQELPNHDHKATNGTDSIVLAAQAHSQLLTCSEDSPRQPSNESSHKSASSIWQAAQSDALRPFVIISSSYLLFTVTDGALRMIVLLHAYNLRLSALQVAVMFTLYELAGVVTNLAAGIMGAYWGIKYTLIGGLCLQFFSLGLLLGWQNSWSPTTAIVYVTIAQMFAGIAKDLTKLGGKTGASVLYNV
jgi:Na+/melibiose symporter-like transporter